ncbi:hypothetical protein FJZ17_01245 [Candidatus Pacearchaeota archaeon]|nr:hypothetical protein [Candidatus Pacearchaeota archaeon]
MKRAKSIGVPIVLLGILITFSSPLTRITGFTIAGQVLDSLGYWSYGLGLALILIGAALRSWEDLDDIPVFQRMWVRARRKDNLRPGSQGDNIIMDAHARYVYTQLFMEQYHRKPTKGELHAFMREDHNEPGRINEVVGSFDSGRYPRELD